MKKLARLLLIALIACAVPVQGAWALGAAPCMALQEHDAAAAHDHGSAPAQSQNDNHDGQHSNHDGDAAASHCGPCAACCASASIAGPAALVLLFTGSNAPYVLLQSPSIGIQPDGLDRPPLPL